MKIHPTEDTKISAMARELRPLTSFDIKGVAKFALTLAGFPKPEIERFVEPAIVYERGRRAAFPLRAC